MSSRQAVCLDYLEIRQFFFNAVVGNESMQLRLSKMSGLLDKLEPHLNDVGGNRQTNLT
jgi:hypothetical protein